MQWVKTIRDMKTVTLCIMMLLLTLEACESEKKRRPVYVGIEDVADETSGYDGGEVVAIPFRNENGVKYVQVAINGVNVEMIFDTGCSGALISVAEANYLYRNGTLTADDILGTAASVVADGRVVENAVVNLREVVIGGRIRCPDVQATVSGNIGAPLLLGNALLDRLATIEIDNQRQTINFKLK